jgi:hypothetical protein
MSEAEKVDRVFAGATTCRQLTILPTCHFANLPFCQLAILPHWHYVILSKWYANLHFCKNFFISTCHFSK